MSGPTVEQIAAALVLPVDEARWQSACEFEQRCMHEFMRQRAKRGKFVGATIFGALIELAQAARIAFEEDQGALNMMPQMFAEAYAGSDGEGMHDA